MANNTASNITRKVARVFLKEFEASRVLSKTVDTQLLDGKFNPSSGSTADFKRPHDYNVIDTSGGDISSSTKSDILSGKATGTVQNYITVATEWSSSEEALQLDQLSEILKPAATRMVTDLELKLGRFMYKNCNLSIGTPGTGVDAWADVTGSGSLMQSIGVPTGDWTYACNPYTQQALAATQYGLGSGDNRLVNNAWEDAQIKKIGGLNCISSNTLPTRVVTTAADLVGKLNAAPTATYVAHKDTMIQSWVIKELTASAVVKAGDIIEVTGKTYRSMATRETFLDATGAAVKFRGTVTADATANSSGVVTVLVAGPAIFESTGQYNTVSAALAEDDVVTILGTSGATVQPNMFYAKQAFGLGTVRIPKLYSTDTTAETCDGFSIRVSKYSDGDANTQKIRFDLLPAFACFNPFFAGQGHGIA